MYLLGHRILAGVIAPVEKGPSEWDKGRRRALMKVDRELSRGFDKRALDTVKQLQGKPGGLRGFGTAKQVPKKPSSVDEMELNGVDYSYLNPLVHSIMDSIYRCIQFSLEEEVSTNTNSTGTASELLQLEEGSESFSEEDLFMFAQHEAGHFLVGYLLGVLPKEYILPRKGNQSLAQVVGGRVGFVGFEFLREIPDAKVLEEYTNSKKPYYKENRRNLSSKTFNNLSCVLLGGLVAEQLTFGYSEGLHSDVNQLDRVMKWRGLSQFEANFHIKWAAANTAFILHHHHETISRLAEAMTRGKPISYCIDTIEHTLCSNDI